MILDEISEFLEIPIFPFPARLARGAPGCAAGAALPLALRGRPLRQDGAAGGGADAAHGGAEQIGGKVSGKALLHLLLCLSFWDYHFLFLVSDYYKV